MFKLIATAIAGLLLSSSVGYYRGAIDGSFDREVALDKAELQCIFVDHTYFCKHRFLLHSRCMSAPIEDCYCAQTAPLSKCVFRDNAVPCDIILREFTYNFTHPDPSNELPDVWHGHSCRLYYNEDNEDKKICERLDPRKCRPLDE